MHSPWAVKVYDELTAWKQRLNRSALEVSGVRQVFKFQ